MERLAYLTTGDRIEAEDLAFILSPSAGSSAAIGAGLNLNDATHEFQRKHVQQAIDAARGNVSQAAKNLGVHRSNLYRKMRQLGMETDEEDAADD
jgi:Nif-specific regulatory protein